METKKQNPKNELFAPLPKVVRLKKSILIVMALLGGLMLGLILSFLPQQEVKSPLEDSLETEADNAHWLSASKAADKELKQDRDRLADKIRPENETDQLTKINEINKIDEKHSEPNSLAISPSQQQQLARALEEIKDNELAESNKTLNQDKQEAIKSAADSPIAVSLNAGNEIKVNGTFQTSQILHAGSLIPIQFMVDVNSELPGFALTQVNRNILDHQDRIVIPQGTKVMLQYEATYANNNRLAYKAISMLLPTGKTILLDNAPVVDRAGTVGLKDKSHHHALRNLLASIGSMAMAQATSAAVQQIPTLDGAQTYLPIANENAFSQIPTTFYIRKGYECNVLLTHDLSIPS